MKEQILELLKQDSRALSVYEIEDALDCNTVEGLKEILKALNELEDELQIYRSNKNNYMLFNNSHLKIGTMLGTKKDYGFVDIDGDDDVFVPSNAINNAIHGDKVVVEITNMSPKGLEGRIVKIVSRNLELLVGEIFFEDNQYKVKLDEEKLKIEIIIKKDDLKTAMPGHKVLVKTGKKLKNNIYEGEIVKVIGHKNDPGVDILSIVYKYGINDAFSDEVIKELEEIPNSVSEEEIEKRLNHGGRDLRNEMIFTIDGDDTKDIDDAISLEKLNNGNYRLGVHIADVSYYVKTNTKIYDEARERGTSVYLADRVIPMLPHKLSNGICSLNPNEDRLAQSCVMEINSKGDIVDYEIFEAVIKSRKQMTYKNVNKILEENIIPEGYEEFADKLREMYELTQILRKNKVARGYIDFDIDEGKIIVDEEGKAIDVILRNRGIGENMIEDFMIAANETVATHIYFMELPFIYRVHGVPREEKINQFLTFVSSLGYKVNGKIHDATPKDMQNILEQLKDKKEFHILSSLLLRSMQKAVYDITNIGHFGLASKYYTHFTSPIRRFPDTTVHRLLRTYLYENHIDKDTVKYLEGELPIIAEHSSQKERASISCERDVDDMKKAEYMMNHIGEIYHGMISSIMNFGMFIELPNLVEGLIKIDDLDDDYYTYDESTITLRGKKNVRGFHLGDELDVIVVRADKEARKIDFVIATEENKKKYCNK